jgi:hypothetical protein
VEAASFAKRSDENCRRWYDRKKAKTSTAAWWGLNCPIEIPGQVPQDLPPLHLFFNRLTQPLAHRRVRGAREVMDVVRP